MSRIYRLMPGYKSDGLFYIQTKASFSYREQELQLLEEQLLHELPVPVRAPSE